MEDRVAGALDPVAFRIVKVPHHSSGSSSAGLVEATNPCVAVVSAGYANPFGGSVFDLRDRAVNVHDARNTAPCAGPVSNTRAHLRLTEGSDHADLRQRPARSGR